MSLDNTYRFIAQTVFQHLDPKTTSAFVFGSRVANQAQKFSDIDVGLESSRFLSPVSLELIQEKLENSDLPYRVDLVDFASVNDKFKQVAKQHIIDLKSYLHDQNRKS